MRRKKNTNLAVEVRNVTTIENGISVLHFVFYGPKYFHDLLRPSGTNSALVDAQNGGLPIFPFKGSYIELPIYRLKAVGMLQCIWAVVDFPATFARASLKRYP